MLDRLMGTETEYAIRYDVAHRVSHINNQPLFDRIADAVGRLVHTREGEGLGRTFTENGGNFVFEQSRLDGGGLFEAATPECRGPAQVLLYQRAQDALLTQAVTLAQRGIEGEPPASDIGLLKNCRDAAGNVYGAQESYEVPIARGPRLLAWRLALALAAPLALLFGGLVIAWLVASLLALVLAAGVAIAAAVAFGRVDIAWERWMLDVMNRLVVGPSAVLFTPPVLVVALAARAFAYRPYRREAMGFLVSRCVLSGAGTRRDDGGWSLSEKAADIRRSMRLTVLPDDRGLIEIGNLLKPLQALTILKWRAFADVFRRRQRLQLGLADANRCDVAEYLKLGSTALVLDMVEAGVLRDAPRPRRPIRAVQALSHDATLEAEVLLRDGSSATALALQRFYCERAATWVEQVAAPLEAHRLVRLWRDTLDQLEADPEALVGQLDWVTKRALVARAATDDPDADKKIDLRYHELGPEGYFTWLQDAGLTTRLVTDEAIEAAIRTPPDDTPAHQRGDLVRALSTSQTPSRVGWNRVKVGRGLRGQVIRLDDHR